MWSEGQLVTGEIYPPPAGHTVSTLTNIKQHIKLNMTTKILKLKPNYILILLELEYDPDQKPCNQYAQWRD